MSIDRYLSAKSENDTHASVNVVELRQKVKLEEKRQQKKLMFVVSLFSILAVFFITVVLII